MDRRLIQTAVFGSPDSDEPALCPEDPQELDLFRREHANDTVWCGTLLEGGCGLQLMTKRYTDRICHFAHYRDSEAEHQCGRRSRDRNSANHLFVKTAFAAWLRTQGLSGEFEYPEPIGSAVVIRLEDGRVLHIHLDQHRPIAWNDKTVWETVLGPGVGTHPDVLTQRGYAHRIRFEDQPGGRRAVRFGTERPGAGTRWFGLDELALTSDGMSAADQPAAVPTVPSSEVTGTLSRTPRTIVPIAHSTTNVAPTPRQVEPARQALFHLDRALRSDQPKRIAAAMHTAQRMLDRTIEPGISEQLRAALARGQRWQEQRARLRSTVVARLQEDHQAGLPIKTLLAQALNLVQDDGAPEDEKAAVHDIQTRVRRAQEEKRKAQARAEAARQEAEARKEAERLAAARQAIRERQEQQERAARQARLEQLRPLAATVRGALKKAAREGRSTTWPDLETRTGQRQLIRLTHEDEVEVLVMVDSDTSAEAPLWSTLLVVEGTPAALRLHRDVAQRLGRLLPVDDAELISHLTAERAALHRQHSYP